MTQSARGSQMSSRKIRPASSFCARPSSKTTGEAVSRLPFNSVQSSYHQFKGDRSPLTCWWFPYLTFRICLIDARHSSPLLGTLDSPSSTVTIRSDDLCSLCGTDFQELCILLEVSGDVLGSLPFALPGTGCIRRRVPVCGVVLTGGR